jgi:hypothetical protein
MRPSDWDDPRIRAIGRRYAAEAYNLASELEHYGADAERLIMVEPFPSPDVIIPAGFADALMAILLSLSGERRPGAALGENVVRLKPRPASSSGGPYCPDAA